MVANEIAKVGAPRQKLTLERRARPVRWLARVSPGAIRVEHYIRAF